MHTTAQRSALADAGSLLVKEGAQRPLALVVLHFLPHGCYIRNQVLFAVFSQTRVCCQRTAVTNKSKFLCAGLRIEGKGTRCYHLPPLVHDWQSSAMACAMHSSHLYTVHV